MPIGNCPAGTRLDNPEYVPLVVGKAVQPRTRADVVSPLLELDPASALVVDLDHQEAVPLLDREGLTVAAWASALLSFRPFVRIGQPKRFSAAAEHVWLRPPAAAKTLLVTATSKWERYRFLS